MQPKEKVSFPFWCLSQDDGPELLWPIQPAAYTLYSDPKTFVSNVGFVSFATDIVIFLLSLCHHQYFNSSWMSKNTQIPPLAGYK